MNEITLLKNNELSNHQLSNEVKKIANAFGRTNNNAWNVADSIHTILVSECWKDDFKSLANLAEYLGFGSKSSFSEMKKAVEFMTVLGTDKKSTISLSKAVKLSNVGEDLIQSAEWTLNNLEFIETHSVKDVTELIKSQNQIETTADNTIEDDTDEDTLDIVKDTESTSDDISVSAYIQVIGSTNYIILTYGNTTAQIPVRKLGKIMKDFPFKG